MKMKKIISLFLCAAMLFCISCNNGEPYDSSITAGGPTELPEVSLTEIVTDADTDAVETTDEDTVQTELITEETTYEPTEESTEPPAPEDILIYQAHRGYSTKFPENTVLAVEEAIKAGFKICEIDPNFTADGRAVLMHDSTVNRTCRKEDGSTLPENTALSSLTYAEISKLDAGIFKGEQFKGTRVPLLEDVVKVAAASGITVKIDNKIQKFSAAEQEIVFMIAEKYPETVGITCKDLDFVQKVIDRLPNAIIHYDGSVNEAVCKTLKKVVGDNRLYIWYPVANATEDICNAIKKYGILGLWTVKSEPELKRAIAFGADVIETNGEVIPE